MREPPSGPASTSIVRPESRTSTESPWPTSRNTKLAARAPVPAANTSVTRTAHTPARTALPSPGSGQRTQVSTPRTTIAVHSSHAPTPTGTAAAGIVAMREAAFAEARIGSAATSRGHVGPPGRSAVSAVADSPATSPIDTNGTTTTLASGAASDSKPKTGRQTADVADCAVNVIDKGATIRSRSPTTPVTHSRASPPNNASPSTARTDIWRPSSKTHHGLSRTMRHTAEPRAPIGEARLPAQPGAVPAASIVAARTADTWTPVSTTKPAPASKDRASRGRRPSPKAASTAPTATHASPRWSPDTARRCESPKERKSLASSVSATLRRSPRSTPQSRSPPGP